MTPKPESKLKIFNVEPLGQKSRDVFADICTTIKNRKQELGEQSAAFGQYVPHGEVSGSCCVKIFTGEAMLWLHERLKEAIDMQLDQERAESETNESGEDDDT